MDRGKRSVWICQVWATVLLAMRNNWFDVRMVVLTSENKNELNTIGNEKLS